MRENQYLFITLMSQKSEKHVWDTRGYLFKHVFIWRHVLRARRQE